MTNEMMETKVLFFGACREAVGADELFCQVAVPATVATLWGTLQTLQPALSRFAGTVLFAVNEEHAQPAQSIQPGDVVAIFPPVSGG